MKMLLFLRLLIIGYLNKLEINLFCTLYQESIPLILIIIHRFQVFPLVGPATRPTRLLCGTASRLQSPNLG